MNLNLEGKVALVTGSARGMGAAVALGLAKEGVDIAALDIGGDKNSGFGTRSQLEEVVKEIKKLGREAIAIYADLTQEDQVMNAMKEVVSKFGKLHILVNCVGFIRFGLVKDMPFADWKRVFDINTHAHFLACKHAIPLIVKAGWGRIVNISSNGGLRGLPNYSAYCAAKFATIGLTQSLANELGKHNITANAVCPGATGTEFLYNQAPMLNTTREELEKAVISRNIIEEMEKPEDIANAIIWLCSERAHFVTGHSLLVEGGSLTRMS